MGQSIKRHDLSHKGSKQYWTTVESMYRDRFNSFVLLASRHVYNKDLAVDVVHDAFVKVLKYFNEHPDRKVREHIVNHKIIQACKRANKYSKELPSGLMRGDDIKGE